MGGRIDLHIHSHFSSDGDVAPERLIDLARENGLRAISISDHDTVAAYPEALSLGEAAGVEVIPGIELTTLHEDREFHLLLPFVDWHSETTAALEEEVRRRRMLEARDRVDKLKALGIDIEWEDVILESSPFPPLGVTIAQAVLRKAEQNGRRDLMAYLQGENRRFAPYHFYRDYFMDGRPASVPRRNLPLLEALEKAKQTGGVPVLAHPGAPFQRAGREDIALLKEHGLQGLEVFTTYHDKVLTETYRALAEEFDLAATVGSDFHGSIKPDISFGCVRDGGYGMIDELRRRRDS